MIIVDIIHSTDFAAENVCSCSLMMSVHLTIQGDKISHKIIKYGYIKEAVQYTDYANDNCIAGCLDWSCLTV